MFWLLVERKAEGKNEDKQFSKLILQPNLEFKMRGPKLGVVVHFCSHTEASLDYKQITKKMYPSAC